MSFEEDLENFRRSLSETPQQRRDRLDALLAYIAEGHNYFDPDGRPLTVEEWGLRFEDFTSRVLARTQVGPHEIRTVWHGLDPEYAGGEDPGREPRVFGSIVVTDGRYHHEVTASTHVEAMFAHNWLVARVENDELGPGEELQ